MLGYVWVNSDAVFYSVGEQIMGVVGTIRPTIGEGYIADDGTYADTIKEVALLLAVQYAPCKPEAWQFVSD